MEVCVFCCFDDLTEVDSGALVRIYNLVKNLVVLGNVVNLIIPGDHENVFEWTEGIRIYRMKGLIPYRFLKILSKIVGVARASSLYFFDVSLILRAGKIIKKSEIVQVEIPISAPLITFIVKHVFRKPVVIDSHDAFQSLKIEYINELRRQFETVCEKIAYRLADLIVTVSKKEKTFLLRICRKISSNNVIIVPNGVDTQTYYLKKAKPKEYTSKNLYKIVFVGNMEYLPNQEAAEIIVSRIAPLVLSKMKNVEFLLVGRPPPSIPKHPPSIVFTGVVENVLDFLSISHIAIAPLLQGSGTRLKILEYCSCGLPIVSTSKGAEGLDVENGKNIIIEDDIENFANRIMELLVNSGIRRELGKAARDFAVKKYDWKIATQELDRFYKALIKSV